MNYFTFAFTFLQLWSTVKLQKNIASTGTASQSSVLNWYNYGHPKKMTADLAIIGGPTNDYTQGSCAMTDNNYNEAWWMLTFPVNTIFVTSVRIFYRGDILQRFSYYSLYISNTSISSHTPGRPPDNDLCYRHVGPDSPSLNETHNCNAMGKNVILYNNRTDSSAYLELCDVQVYGCYKGWSGNDCSVPCPSICIGKHCYPDNRTCVWGQWPDTCLRDIRDSVSGVCLDGCKNGLAGQYCNKYNLASNKITVLQPPDNNQFSDVVTDGERTTSSCLRTSGNVSWLQINLSSLTVITAIHITYKNDDTVKLHSEGHDIHVTNTSGLWTGGVQLILKVSNGFPYIIYDINPVIGQYFIYVPKVTNGIAYTNICEIEVIGCPYNKYGLQCNKTCPVNCGGPCHPETGECIFGCKDGWLDSKFCEKPCTSPYFGNTCLHKCYCLNGTLCNHVNGTCPLAACEKGWESHSCSRECSLGYFGFNCNESCDGCLSNSCDREFGVCTNTSGCKPGWYSGHSKCDKACPDWYFGDCKSRCYCLKGACNKTTGTCPGLNCQKGWMGETCGNECNNGTYGINCANSCNNCRNHSCDRFEGNCAFRCTDGFHGHQCQLRVSSITEEKYQNDLIYASSGTFIVTAVLCITIFLLILWR